MGAVINDSSLPEIAAKVACGLANNQLAEPRHGKALQSKGITCVPDYVVNAGGIMGASTMTFGTPSHEVSISRILELYETILSILDRARSIGRPCSVAADEMAEARITAATNQIWWEESLLGNPNESGIEMPAYVVSMMSVHDAETYRKYTDRTPPIVKRHGGRFLTRGEAITCVEGTNYDGRMVILEFPSKAHVEAWFADPDYQEAMAFRHAASTMHMLLLQEGGQDTEAPDPKL